MKISAQLVLLLATLFSGAQGFSPANRKCNYKHHRSSHILHEQPSGESEGFGSSSSSSNSKILNDDFIQKEFEHLFATVEGKGSGSGSATASATASTSSRTLGPKDVLIYDTTLRGEFNVFSLSIYFVVLLYHLGFS